VKQQIFYSVADFFRSNSALRSKDILFISQALFLWLKTTNEQKLDDDESYKGKEEVSDRFERFFHNFCTGYRYDMRKAFKLNDESFYAIVEKVNNSLRNGLITYFDVAEIAFQLSSQEQDFETQTPNELVELGSGLLSGNITSAYCPFTASYRFAEALSLQNKDVSIELSNESDTAWTRMSADLKDVKYHQEWLPSNPITDPIYIDDKGLKQFSHTLAMAPFGLKYPKNTSETDIFGRFPEKSLMGEVLQLRHMLAQSSDQVVTFVYNAFLSRTAAGEKQFKQDVIKQGWLHSVIALPPKLLNNTQIQINALVFDKRKAAEKVLFIDSSGDEFIKREGKKVSLNNVEGILYLHDNPAPEHELSIEVSPDVIEKNDFNLLPSRYVLSPEQEQLNDFLSNQPTQKLEAIAELITPQAIKDELAGEVAFHEFGVSHVNDIGELIGDGKKVLTTSQISRANKQLIQTNDILIVNKGSVGKIVLVENPLPTNSMPSQAFSIVRIHKHVTNISPVSLFQYLLSPLGQVQLKALSTGETVTMIGNKDLKSMQIPVFSEVQAKEAQQIRNNVKSLYNKLFEIKKEINQLNQSNWIN
jgi:type I restriction enzyme M protein